MFTGGSGGSKEVGWIVGRGEIDGKGDGCAVVGFDVVGMNEGFAVVGRGTGWSEGATVFVATADTEQTSVPGLKVALTKVAVTTVSKASATSITLPEPPVYTGSSSAGSTTVTTYDVMIVVAFVEKHWSSSRRLLPSVGRGVGADDGMMVGWGVGTAVGTSVGIDDDGIDEGAVVGSNVGSTVVGSAVDSAVGGAVVGMDEGLVVGAVVGAAVTFMSAQTMCPMRLRSTPSNSAR